ncbi:MAG: hypothetical protein P4M09_22930 [Devosia sp.]|nr:hypothetical protein [Devosia sp.]
MAELLDEQHREAVEAAKNAIRAREAAARWWHSLFPFKVRIERRS